MSNAKAKRQAESALLKQNQRFPASSVAKIEPTSFNTNVKHLRKRRSAPFIICQ